MKIYISEHPDALMGDIRKNDLPFHLERDQWEFVSNIEEADVIPLINCPVVINNLGLTYTLEDQLNIIRPYKDKIFLLMVHNHIAETMGGSAIDLYLSGYSEFKNIHVVSVNLVPYDRQISYNYYFNWVKAHFTQYTKHDLKFNRMWVTACSRDSFILPNINLLNATKKFCIPNVVRIQGTTGSAEFKNYAREILAQYTDPTDSYYSDFRKNVQLMPEESCLYPSAYRGVEKGNTGVGIIPISNNYFTDSIVSVFVESVGKKMEPHGVLAFTEKTYIPLLKGHFILPFGSDGSVQELKKQGFMFPEWIDYSYDLIHNDENRLTAYIDSLKKLRKISIEKLNELANNDIHIRKHNRQVIIRTPFDSIYLKIKELMK